MINAITLVVWTAISNSCFAEVPPIADDEARPRVSCNDANSVVGRVAFVSGRISSIRTPEGLTLIDFYDHKPPMFTAVIRRADYERFPAPPKEFYRDKIVRIRGLVTTYRGVPQISVTSPNQVEILDALPKTEPVEKSAQPKSSGKLRLAEYNVFNLFDADDDPYRADEATPPKPRAELEALAQSIRSLNADVLALEEIENRGYLERFFEVFLSDMGYKNFVLFEGNDRRGIDVALVSRLPIGPVESNRHVTFPGPGGKRIHFARDVLEVTVEPEVARSFKVWVIHLQSNSQGRDYAEPIRVAEARQIRRMLDAELEHDPDVRIVLTGDFNDTWDSETMKTIVGGDGKQLWSAASDHNGELPDTYNQGPFHSMIDFVLLTPAMAKQIVPGSFRVVPGSPETTGSDHNPVAIEFDLSTAP